MAFTILDNDEVFNTNQAIWMQTDINALVAGIGGDGVVSGCAVTAQGSPDMTVAVAVGVVKVGATVAAVTAGNVTITTADATNPRIDLIVVSNAGAKSCTAGTAAANPKAPDIPASSVLLAMVYVPANDTTIATNQITDKRNILDSMFAMWHPVADADYTAIAGDRAVGYTSITAARTVTLPLAAAVPAGQELIVADVSGSVTSAITITIARAGSDTINGATSYVISTLRGLVRLISDGSSKWYFDIVGPGRGGQIAEGAITSNLSVPGVELSAATATAGLSVNLVRYMGIEVHTTITIDQLVCYITTAAAAGKLVRMAIYNAKIDWSVGSLVVDGGTVAADTTGLKIASISTVLPPGRYYMAINSDGTPTCLFIRGGSRLQGFTNTATTNFYNSGITAAQTFGAFPDPGTAYSAPGVLNVPPPYFMFVRVSVP